MKKRLAENPSPTDLGAPNNEAGLISQRLREKKSSLLFLRHPFTLSSICCSVRILSILSSDTQVAATRPSRAGRAGELNIDVMDQDAAQSLPIGSRAAGQTILHRYLRKS
jgi:hypothetical protein